MKTRAQRRADRERLEKKRRVIYSSDTVYANERGLQLGRRLKRGEAKRRPERIDTPTPCSCWMCGNPRRKAGKITLAEQQSHYDLVQQLKEL